MPSPPPLPWASVVSVAGDRHGVEIDQDEALPLLSAVDDRELAQVTVKPVEAALSATPIVLLSGSAAQLHDSFEISAAAAHDGMDWVEVKPRSTEADFNHAELGFSGGKLVRMVVNDRLGQTVQLDFQHSERNARVDADALRFKPPAGVDVIGTPQG